MRFPDPDKPEEYLHHEILLPEDKANKILAGDYSDFEQADQSESLDESNHTLSEAGDEDNIENAVDVNSDEEFEESEEQVKDNFGCSAGIISAGCPGSSQKHNAFH